MQLKGISARAKDSGVVVYCSKVELTNRIEVYTKRAISDSADEFYLGALEHL